MPFPLLPSALAICFALVWAFIGIMILRDSQLAARRERDADDYILPIAPRKPFPRPVRSSAAIARRRKLTRQKPIRAAS